jgi:hypothetical protein
MMARLLFNAVASAAAVAIFVSSISVFAPAAAEDITTYPSATIRIVVPYPAGGTADALPRIIGDRLQAHWSEPVIIVNRPGAGGNIGAEMVAMAEPNGYTLLASPPGPLAINEALYKKLAYRPAEFESAIVMGSVPNVMDVPPAFPAKSAHDALNYILANPGKVTFASQGVGTTSHLAGLLFERLSNSSMVHVPYGGSAPALQDIMGDRVDLLFDNFASSLLCTNRRDCKSWRLEACSELRRCRRYQPSQKPACRVLNPAHGLRSWRRQRLRLNCLIVSTGLSMKSCPSQASKPSSQNSALRQSGERAQRLIASSPVNGSVGGNSSGQKVLRRIKPHQRSW